MLPLSSKGNYQIDVKIKLYAQGEVMILFSGNHAVCSENHIP